MGRDGLFIQYKDGIDTLMVAGQSKRYPAGKVLCDILQGEIREWLLEWPCDFIIGYGHGGDEMIQDNIIEAVSGIETFLEDAGKNPVAVCLADAVFLDCVEKYNAVVQEYPERLESLEYSMNEILYDNDIRKDYLPGIIHFDDIGGFLKACYFDYLADIFDGILFFYAEAAGDTGTSVDGQDELRERFLKELETSDHIDGLITRVIYDRKRDKYSYKYEIRSVRALAAFEIMHMRQTGALLRRCQNPECGKFFLARRRSAMYCSYPAPQRPDKSCKEYYPQIKSEAKRKKDELNTMYRSAQSRLLMNMKRNPDTTKSAKYNEMKYKLTHEHIDKEQAVQRGEMTKKEYAEWLDKFR